MKKSSPTCRAAAFGIAALAWGALAAGGMAGAVWAMGAPTPPPPPVRVERAPPARPAHPAEPRHPPASDAAAPDPAPVVAGAAARPQLEYLLATDVTPGDLLYRRRAVVVFAATPADPAFTVQMVALETQAGPLADRDVVVISDSEPSDHSAWRRMLNPNGFSLVIIDKDGQVKQRKPIIWDTREIARAIDKFPSRRAEIGRAGFAQ